MYTNVLSSSVSNEGYQSFSASNLVHGKQLRNKEFREYNETEEGPNPRSLKLRYCVTRAECVPLNYSTCFGVKVPYTRTSLGLVPDVTSQEEAQVNLPFIFTIITIITM